MSRAALWFLGTSVNLVVSLPLVPLVAVAGCLSWAVRELHTAVIEWAGQSASSRPSIASAATMSAALGVGER